MKRINVYKSTFVATIVCTLIAFCGCTHDANIDVKTISGDATKADGWLTAQTKTVVEADILASATHITVRGRTGKVQNKHNQGVSVSFLDKNDHLPAVSWIMPTSQQSKPPRYGLPVERLLWRAR